MTQPSGQTNAGLPEDGELVSTATASMQSSCGMKLSPVSEDVVVGRINRQLKREHCAVRRRRKDSKACLSRGRYYLLDLNRNLILWDGFDLEVLARKTGALWHGDYLDQ